MAASSPFELKTAKTPGLVNSVAMAPPPGAAPAVQAKAAPPGGTAPGAPDLTPKTPAATTAPAAAALAAPTAPTAAPVQRPVVAETDTVQGQLAGILTKGSPLLVQAQTRANQQANKRGLLNSSLAVSAGEAALYDAAMPIAQQDAETYSRTGEANAGRAQETALANQDNQTKLMLQQMDANTRVEMTNIEATYKTLMQASDSASSLYSQTLKNITDISLNDKLPAGSKNAAIARQRELLINGMNLLGGMNSLDLDNLLDFSLTEVPGPAAGAPGPAPAPGYEDPDRIGGR